MECLFCFRRKDTLCHIMGKKMVYLCTNMEFLDPANERRSRVMLFIEYGLVAIAITFASLILLYWSYGFSLNREGEVQQNGLVFISSDPQGASITLNGEVSTNQSNARLSLESGKYDIKVSLAGYRDWQHSVTVDGSDIQRLDYLKLIPETLKTTEVEKFDKAPLLASQSPNRRWLVIKDAITPALFSVFDFRNPESPNIIQITLSETAFTAGDGENTWKAVEWSSDNRHVLLQHTYSIAGVVATEYIVFDRTSSEQSRNLTTQLKLTADETPQFFDKQSNQFYVYNMATKVLRSTDLDGQEIVAATENVIDYKTYGNDTVLYVTEKITTDGIIQRFATFKNGEDQMQLRQLSAPTANGTYLLDVAKYSNTWYIVVGETAGRGVYVFKNPLSQKLLDDKMPKPWRFLRRNNPTNVSFSSNARFLLVQSGQDCTVYDAENVITRQFSIDQPLQPPDANIRWMDGFHLTYTSQGKSHLIDFDKRNHQVLVPILPEYTPFFVPNNDYIFTLAPTAQGTSLTSTSFIASEK